MRNSLLRTARGAGGTAVAVALCALVAGCSGAATANRSLESLHQPVVMDDEVSYLVRADGGQLSPGEATRFAEWLGAIDARYGDTIMVDRAAAFGSGMAIDDIADIVSRRGLMVDDAAPGLVAAADPGVVRVVVRRTRAHVPGCPDHSSKSSRNIANATSSNYGCANNANMAAMIADPNDLIRGATTTVTDPRTSGRAIRTYRERGAGAAPKPSATATATGTGGGQ